MQPGERGIGLAREAGDVGREGARFGLRRDPITEKELREAVIRLVKEAVGGGVFLEPAGFDGGAGEEADGAGVNEDGGGEDGSVDAGGFGGAGAGDGFGVNADVKAVVVKEARGGLVHDNEHGLDGGAADLETEAGLAGLEVSGEAPGAVGAADEDDAVTVFDAEDEARFELVGDDDAASTLKDLGWDGGFGAGHELAEDGLAGFELGDIVCAG